MHYDANLIFLSFITTKGIIGLYNIHLFSHSGISCKQRKNNDLNHNLKGFCRQVVLNYFHSIIEKDMHTLLDMLTDDCVIYEPFSKGNILYNNGGEKESCLKGGSEIESFLSIVMMASDELRYEVKFMDEPMDLDYKKLNDDNFEAMPSSTIISALDTFYKNEGGDQLKERLTFHIVPERNHESAISMGSDYNNNNNINNRMKMKIKTLWIQSCSPESIN